MPSWSGGVGARIGTVLCAFDAFLPVCKGQRIGVFAGPGVGKSMLLADLARNIDADVSVIALIGERGRDNGALIVLALAERSVWIEAGYGLEEWITDGFAGETSREVMIPEFRRGDYGGGLLAGTTRVIGRIAQGRNVTLEGVEPPRDSGGDRRDFIVPAIIFAFILLMVLGNLGGGKRNRLRGRNVWTSGVGPFGAGYPPGVGTDLDGLHNLVVVRVDARQLIAGAARYPERVRGKDH